MTLPLRELGKTGVKISVIGLGCMGMSEFYGSSDEQENIKVLNRVLELGCNFWDTSVPNEILISKILKDRRDEVFICTKFGVSNVSGKPEYARQACENSLKRLEIDCIDLYYQHRVDPETPIEDTVGALAELVKEGKIKYIGLSECSAATLRRAHKVHPISAVQIEYSPWTLDIETNGIMETCRELGITIVAYGALGRGFLTGKFRSIDDFDPDDIRRNHPRFQAETFAKNLELADKFSEFASKKGLTSSQLCLAWVLAQSDNIVAIPGTRKIKYLEENLEAAKIQLSPEELSEIRQIIDSFEIIGDRYTAAGMKDQSRTHLPLGSLSKTQLIDVMCRIDVALISYNKSVTIKVAGETKRFWQVGKMLKW
ncbi:aldo/keto reductase [Rhizophagus irregularis DAOM 181602=DAOM 197198]|uniref:Aldo/keto reductase n=1 Tax=Rhizophagus irregularis (strain DAOM 181602 / DAOM 197198 / MUCL 43194) TaxID=747089 RepID=A0A2P4P4A1_RHIID|nr:aldo/keto reductase [Rhizophagus irregularis DAOM 181602=DAOM 197198]POG60212.1 aldo/keto reductase [Rhizophagus irregularis DAOM 181602=DAOM 197198]|eukprot:XP_025167078.1 aldo/keto reductase [Rhizophagus irregularis DAOM 181602=DAOM 197198]